MAGIVANLSFFSSAPRPAPEGGRSNHSIVMVIKVAGLLLVSVLLVTQAGKLWQEWTMLQGAVHGSRQSAVAGYLNIAPTASFIEGPKDWYRDDGKQTLLWSGWEHDVSHWFRFAHGEIDPSRLSRPTGEYIVQPIDFPIVEIGGGTIWQRVPPESVVVGHTIENRKCAYPVAILGKVLVINDLVDQRPYLVVVNPLLLPRVAFAIYEASLDGHRVTLAHTGYFQDGKPVLFDRGTESLWVDMHDGLTAIAGKHARKRLVKVALPSPVSWSTWRSRNPQSRLLVGADRSRGVPSE
jgi:uncharacterized protein DUF3179